MGAIMRETDDATGDAFTRLDTGIRHIHHTSQFSTLKTFGGFCFS